MSSLVSFVNLINSLLKYNICLSGFNCYFFKCYSPGSFTVSLKVSACFCNFLNYFTVFNFIKSSAYFINSILCKTCVRNMVNNGNFFCVLSCNTGRRIYTTDSDGCFAVLNLDLSLYLSLTLFRNLIICNDYAVVYITLIISM